MAKKVASKRYIDNKSGKLTLDGDTVYEVDSVEATIEVTLEEVFEAGSHSPNYILDSVRGTGSYVLKKVVTRGKDSALDRLKNGEVPEFDMITEEGNRTAFGTETIRINAIKLTSFPLANFDVNASGVIQETYEFVFDPEDAEIEDIIDQARLA